MDLRLREPSDLELQSALDESDPSQSDIADLVRSGRDQLLREDRTRRVYALAVLASLVVLLWPVRHWSLAQWPAIVWVFASFCALIASSLLTRPMRKSEAYAVASMIVHRRGLPLMPEEWLVVQKILESSSKAELFIRKFLERRGTLRIAEYDRIVKLFVTNGDQY